MLQGFGLLLSVIYLFVSSSSEDSGIGKKWDRKRISQSHWGIMIWGISWHKLCVCKLLTRSSCYSALACVYYKHVCVQTTTWDRTDFCMGGMEKPIWLEHPPGYDARQEYKENGGCASSIVRNHLKTFQWDTGDKKHWTQRKRNNKPYIKDGLEYHKQHLELKKFLKGIFVCPPHLLARVFKLKSFFVEKCQLWLFWLNNINVCTISSHYMNCCSQTV